MCTVENVKIIIKHDRQVNESFLPAQNTFPRRFSFSRVFEFSKFYTRTHEELFSLSTAAAVAAAK